MANILVIDDSPTVAAVVQRALSPDGHSVKGLMQFSALAQELEAAPPDLILLDLDMPARSGESVAQQIRRCQANIPIVVHSSAPLSVMSQAAKDISACGIVPKGVSADKLRAAVASALRRAKTGTGS